MTMNEHVRELERRITAGAGFLDIEEWVEDIRAPDDVKAALWLLAWSEQEPDTQRRVVCEALAAMGHSPAA